jgi:hypothetical protein
MLKWTLALLLCGFAIPSVRATDPAPRSDAAAAPQNRLAGFVWRVKGRVLGSLVRAGMSDEQVVSLLGKGDKPLLTGGVSGGGPFATRSYSRFGISVSYGGDKEGALRVNGVNLPPLFD